MCARAATGIWLYGPGCGSYGARVKPVSYTHLDVYKRQILGSFAQTHCFPRAVKFLEEGIVKVDDLVSSTYPLSEFSDALELRCV